MRQHLDDLPVTPEEDAAFDELSAPVNDETIHRALCLEECCARCEEADDE